MKKCGRNQCDEQECELCAVGETPEISQLLEKISQMDQELQKLKARVAPLVRLEMAVRSCAAVDMSARELLTAMAGPAAK
jgi:hypothetical protein